MYTLRLSLQSLCQIEAATGLSFGEFGARLDKKTTVTDLRLVLWTAAQEFHAETFPTLESFALAMGAADLPKLLPAVKALISIDPVDGRELSTGRPLEAQANSGQRGRSTSAPALSA